MIEEIRHQLHQWYDRFGRNLPWRGIDNPYYIWISEIILQQTRIDQGTPYYLKFVDAFPSISHLAQASEDQVMRLWQGLGYYSRARNLHHAAKQVMGEFNGIFPTHYKDLLRLKGVGPYTAAAIASICGHENVAVVDGNVSRLIARVFGIDHPIDTTAVKHRIQALAQELLNNHEAGKHNQAMMDFGAIQCVPTKPVCGRCPLSNYCVARAQGLVQRIPAKSKKTKIRHRYFHFLIPIFNGYTWIEKRGERDIWSGLYQFPLIETSSDQLIDNNQIAQKINGQAFQALMVSPVQIHLLTHQRIHAKFYRFECDAPVNGNYQRIKWNELHRFALPRLIERFLEKYEWNDRLQ